MDGGGGGESDATLLTLQKQQREEALKATVVLNLLADGSRKTSRTSSCRCPIAWRRNRIWWRTRWRWAVPARPARLSRNFAATRSSARPSARRVRTCRCTARRTWEDLSAFSAFQPGTSRIFEELFKQSEDTPEFYLSVAPQLAGKTFGEAWRMFPDATLCGLARADGTVELAPDDNTLILVDDEVVMPETSVVTVSPADRRSSPRAGPRGTTCSASTTCRWVAFESCSRVGTRRRWWRSTSRRAWRPAGWRSDPERFRPAARWPSGPRASVSCGCFAGCPRRTPTWNAPRCTRWTR